MNTNGLRVSLLTACALWTATSAFAQIETGSVGIAPTVAFHNAQKSARQSVGAGNVVTTGNQITWQGGPVMHTINAYYIWYGNWGQDPNANAILTDFINNIGGSPYFNINTTYGDNTGNVPSAVTYAGTYTDTGSQGTALTDATLWSVVTNAFTHGLTVDPNGLYFVLTAPGVTESSGFLTQYCGFHTFNTYNTTQIKFAFIGDPGTSIGVCATNNTTISPNGDPQADEMTSVIAHELEETATDQYLNAWYFTTGPMAGDESADACAYTYGTTYAAGNTSLANMHLGTRDYLIQQQWLNAGGGSCAKALAGPDFTISVAPTSQGVPPGGGTTGGYTLTVTPVGGFSAAIHCTVSGLPAGVSQSGLNAKGTCNTGTSFTLTVPASVVNGSYPFTITATGGNLTHAIPATLVVGAVNPAFTLMPVPSTLIMLPGGTSQVSTINVQSLNGFNSAVTLLVAGCPGNTTCTITSPVTPPPNGLVTSPLTVTPSPTTPVGNYVVNVSGNAGAATTNVNVQVQDFSLSPVPTPVSVNQGSTGTSTVSVQSLNGLSQAVTLTASACPANTTCRFSNAQSSITVTPPANGSVTTVLTIATTATTPIGPTNVVITGNIGTDVHAANLALTVNQIPDFSISANPTSITFSKSLNGSGSTTISLTSLNAFAGSVSLAVSGCPGGCTIASPVAVASGGTTNVTLTVQASAKSPPASGTMTVTATTTTLIHQVSVPYTITP